jgi:hypothetical protein
MKRVSPSRVDPADLEALLRREADEYRRQLAILERFAAEPLPETRSGRVSRLTVKAGIRATRSRIEWAEAAINDVRTW